MSNVPSSLEGYRSAGRAPGWFASRWPSLVFYSGLLGIVWRASRKAKAGRYDDREWIGSSLDTVALMESVGIDITIENVAAYAHTDGPAVIVGNHMSTCETFLLPCMLVPHKPVTFVVKSQLVEMPVFKHVMRSRDPVVVGRSDPRADLRTMMDEGMARLEKGISIIVFPQTTRAAGWKPSEFNSIGTKLAARAGVPTIPLALRTDAWSNGKRVKDCGPILRELPVRYCFGDPIEPAGNGRAAHAGVVGFITDKMAEWGVPAE